jgi:cell wall-associated NlpC family hydrolase
MDLAANTKVGSASRVSLVAATVLMRLLASLAGLAPRAHADSVGDLQARARQIAERLDELQRQEGALADQFDGVQIKAQQVAADITATRRRMLHANALVEKRRLELARYSLSAYVSGGGSSDDQVTAMLEGKQDTALRRDGYTAVAVGDRQQLVDDFVAARQVGQETLAELRRSQAAQARLQADLVSKQQQADALTSQQEALQAQVQGKLAVAVAHQQALLAVQAEAAARAKWAAQANQGGSSGATPGSTPTTGGSGTPSSSPTTSPATPTSSPAHGPGTTTPVTTPPTAPPVTAPPVTTPPPPAPPSAGGSTAANAALSQVGVPYSWGGGNSSGPSYGFGTGAHTKGFDCSGLTLYAWAQAGVYLYHNAQSQYDSIRHVSLSQLQPGDLVFYGGSSGSIDHVAIYVGGGTVVHAPHTGSRVQTGPVYLWGGYFSWIGAGRPS